MNRLVPALAMAALLVLPAAAHSTVIVYTAFMDGPSEAPPNASPGTGFVTVTYDSVAQTLDIDATFTGLIGPTTVAHIHCCTAAPLTGAIGVAVTPGTLPGFPVGVTSGGYVAQIDLTLTSSYTGTFLTAAGGTAAGAEAALVTGMNDGHAYFNIHSSVFTGGEIRGFLVPVPVPAAAWLLGSALAGLWGVRRLRS